ncbi:MAG: FmdB family zinc ribbon protein, partial [Terracidiphilus sp.]
TILPLYEYRCTQCGYRFEKIQSFGAQPETECPKCHGALIRPLTAPALQFKGAGWYVNDYASKSTPSSESGAESKAVGDSAKAGSGTESKPAERKASESKASESKPAAASASDSSSSKSSSTS